MARSGNILGVIYPVRHLMIALAAHWMAEQMSVSVLVDITTRALCNSSSPADSCSLPIYLTSSMQTVAGIGKLITLPLIGQLSDEYGRKPVILLTLFSSIVPFVILSIKDTKSFVYAYYVVRTVTNMICQGSIVSVSMAYTADVVDGRERAIAFGYLTGMFSAAHVVGNLLAWLLSEDYIFQVATVLLVISGVYAKLFIVESINTSPNEYQQRSLSPQCKSILIQRWKSIKETITISSSGILRRIICVAFFYELGISGIDNVLMYYLKATFGFDKNQFAQILLAVGVGSIISQLLFLPIFNHFLGEHNVLCMALGASIAYGIFTGLAWATWVPYFAASFGVIYVLVKPCIYVIVSQGASSNDQGKAQGFLIGVQSLASLISPIAMGPLTVLFLSNDPPFHCKGFSLICATASLVVALLQTCLIKPTSPPIGSRKENDYIQVQA
ncbi:hypothetical protein SUGI_1153230 [Cryptomeria japonica]|uniref:uncharacterized protein LOC131075102 isoform X1 n=1 Tax=Cryptomeria japonica TaxID=3369 RepID=UPI0024148969|nr:uncharacterized protein LOC131075102 isoform X1 [Cryptomeria japonica]GLJ53953.1 hypothetical protein SUGI_1153230 [Cryptomeria japonica]